MNQEFFPKNTNAPKKKYNYRNNNSAIAWQ